MEVEEKRVGSCSSQAANATHKIGQWQTKTVNGYLRISRVDVVRAWSSQAPSNGRRRGRHGVQLREDTSKTCVLAFTALMDSDIILRCQISLMSSQQPYFAHTNQHAPTGESVGSTTSSREVRSSNQRPRLHLPCCSEKGRSDSKRATVNAGLLPLTATSKCTDITEKYHFTEMRRFYSHS